MHLALRHLRWLLLPLIAALTGLGSGVYAQSPTTPTLPAVPAMPTASIVQDEGGPVVLQGVITYTNPYFTIGVAEPLIVLEDQAGFIDRNPGFVLPRPSQTLGQITSDFRDSPFSYSLALPIEPQGSLRDVDNDATADTGVMVFAVAYWTNKFGDPFLEQRDLFGGGWSTAYASTLVTNLASRRNEIIGGKLLVYAPDAQQGFPAGFGDDGLLFTADDPIVRLPAGYTVVNLDTTPFTFDRSKRPQIDLLEPEFAALNDFSDLGIAEAFDALIDLLRREYAFTEYKQIDWDALAATFGPRMAEADEKDSRAAYIDALRDFAYAIPDGHIQGPGPSSAMRAAISGGLGLAVRELDDGSVIAVYVGADTPADAAGIRPGDRIVSVNGTPISAYVDAIVPINGPFSTEHVHRLEQLRQAMRFPIGATVELGYIPAGESTPIQASLTAISESASLQFGLPVHTGYELPLDYQALPSGYVHVRLHSFFDNELLTIQLWERLMQTLRSQNAAGLIIDLRSNTGGRGFLADQMAAYFFDTPLTLGNIGRYDAELDDFYFDPRTAGRFYLPAEELRYRGPVAVLVGPNCASACEFFAHAMTQQDRAVMVGHYPTAGLGGSIDLVRMPGGQNFQFTAGRAVDAAGNIHIEGQGIAPDIRVPVTADTLLAGDAVLDAAIRALASKE